MATFAIRRVSAGEIGSDPDVFYARYATEPVIVGDLFEPGHPLTRLSLDGIETLIGDVRMHVYTAGPAGHTDVPAAEVFAGVRGQGLPYNVVDYYIGGTALGELFDVPAFFGHNWFLGAPANRDEREKSLVLSPAGSFTPLHLDACAMQGWMYLIAGCKTWRFYSPLDSGYAFDSARQEFCYPSAETADRYEGTLRAGELLYFPAGWFHQVTTTQASFGVGGSVLNDYQIEEHMRWWLYERAHGVDGGFDLERVIREMPPARFSGQAGRMRAAAAIALCERRKP